MQSTNIENFKKSIESGYNFSADSLVLGTAILDKKVVPSEKIRIPLSTVNRHGLIAGATGTGKTKTIQQFAEGLSQKGISVLLMDIKGDISGIARPGTENPGIKDRQKNIGEPWRPTAYPVELLSISAEKGLSLRFTVSEFGPLLFSKLLELNENQQGTVSLVFKYCEDNKLPLIDINDFRTAVQYISKLDASQMGAYGGFSTTSVGVILRKLLELEQQGADRLFGEPSFDVEDLLRKDNEGRGFINILRLCDIQDKPKLYSSLMICLLAKVYGKFPEIGDRAAPKLVIFIDEAHLLFNDATKALLNQIEMIIKLIRSKGVGIYFCTQLPTDIPDNILSQLGAKFQHALRAFTAKDRKDIKLVSQNYPSTEYYDTDQIITELGIGEALVTVLNEKGNPTPLVQCMLCAPQSRMDTLNLQEQEDIVERSQLARKYSQIVARVGASTILSQKSVAEVGNADRSSKGAKEQESESSEIVEGIIQVTKNPLVKTLANTLLKGVMGAIFGSPKKK